MKSYATANRQINTANLFDIDRLGLIDTLESGQNLTLGVDFVGDKWGLDFVILNASDEDGVNSSMTDVFGVAATGLELIPPRQYMLRLSMNY